MPRATRPSTARVVRDHERRGSPPTSGGPRSAVRSKWADSVSRCGQVQVSVIIDTLADYLMDIGPDQRMVTNPARTAARAAVAAAEAALVAAERALPQLLAGPATTKQKNAARPGAHQRIEAATRTREQARVCLLYTSPSPRDGLLSRMPSSA